MAEVVSFRLDAEEIGRIEKLSEEKGIDKTAAVKELIDRGWTQHVLKQYREGRLSYGRAARELDISISELIDVLAELGISAPLTFEDYLEGTAKL